MKVLIKLTITSFFLLSCTLLISQSQVEDNMRPDNEAKEVVTIKKKIKTWHLSDDYTLIDSLPPDTMLNMYQIINPAFRKNPFNIYTGNLGGPYQSNSLEFMSYDHDFMFINSLAYFFPDPSSFTYYNTTVPYTNLTYSMGSPKSKSEEYLKILFTQNITPNWNLAVSYNLMSSIGRYAGQRNDDQMTRVLMSYIGQKYAIHGGFAYNDIRNYENGGVADDEYILYPEKFNNLDPENIPTNFNSAGIDAKNYLKNYQVFINQSLGIGKIKLKDTTQIDRELPVGTVYHTFLLDTKRRIYKIKNLDSYYADGFENAFYPNIYADSLKTVDSTRLVTLKNTIQIKFNEEANSLLKFGMRAFIENKVKFYRMQAQPTQFTIVDGDYIPQYHTADSVLTTSSIGGQIFKNKGENLWWNAGIRLYFQGYRIGDSEITGSFKTLFRIRKDTAGLYGDGSISLNTPGLLYTKYYSNHIKWDKSFNQEKIFNVRGGIRIPTRRFDISAEMRIINDFLYWNEDAEPDQAGGVVQAYEIKLREHFKLWNLNSVNQVSYQSSNRPAVLPLPDLSVFSTNYYENTLFKVLRMQLGFDVKYHTSYYAPAYYPATGQFYVQNEIKVGNYPFADAFLNFHLKRARIGFKYTHINMGYPSRNYFLIPHYPAYPGSFKIHVSWNFYD